jgi:hypothetical protein
VRPSQRQSGSPGLVETRTELKTSSISHLMLRYKADAPRIIEPHTGSPQNVMTHMMSNKNDAIPWTKRSSPQNFRMTVFDTSLTKSLHVPSLKKRIESPVSCCLCRWHSSRSALSHRRSLHSKLVRDDCKMLSGLLGLSRSLIVLTH